MNENSLIPSETPGGSLRPGYDPYPAGGHQVPTAVNPLKMVHLFLRGRYLILIALILVLTPLGAWLGYRSGHTLYRSYGLIRVKPESQKILYSNEQNSMIPMFNEFLEAEAALMGSQRVLNLALQDDEWKQWKNPLPADLATRIPEEMEVTHAAEMLTVTVWDPDPQAAMLAVKTVIRTYRQIYDEQTNAQQKLRDNVLFGRQQQLTADAGEKSKAILDLAMKYGTDDLKTAYDQKHTEMIKLSEQLAQLQEAVNLGLYSVNAAGPVAQESEEAVIAKADQRMADALRRRDAYEENIRQLEASDILPNNHTMVYARRMLAAVNQDIAKYKSEYEKSVESPAPPQAAAPTTQPAAAAGATTRQVQQSVVMRYNLLRIDLDKINASLLSLGQDKLRLDDLKDQRAHIQDQLRETTQRVDQLSIESSGTTRLEVVTDGEQPAGPRDKKDTHMAMSGAGGAGGFALAAMIVSLLALKDRRMHGPEDTQMSSARVPMLGMLPMLNSDLADPEQAAMAAHFVHGIRAMLQIKAAGDRGRVIAITSPSAHNGKTSLSLALGVSFAGAHSRTLLIDCDFIGRALSSRVNAVARPRLGRVLRHEGLIDEKKLQEGLDQALRRGKRLGEALVDMGCVSQEKMESALGAQKNRSFGVLEAIDGEDLKECIAPTDIPGLSILPLGQANAEHIGSLSPAMIRQVMEATRNEYDVVIVDTGPILGSLEAAMVATQADDVVLVLSNGENRGAAERSVRYLESVGAKVAGFVFNRATTRDFERSDNAQRVSSSADRWRHARGWTQSRQLASFGPVAQAVARSVGDVSSAHEDGNGHNGTKK